MNLNWHDIRRLLLADKRKFSLMLTLGLFGLLLWSRLLFRDVPRTGFAKPGKNGVAAAAPRPAEGGAQSTLPRQPLKVKLVDKLDRDLFETDLSQYSRLETVKNIDREAEAKSRLKQADDLEKEKSSREARVRLQARRLQLQTTLLGDPPRAVINKTPVELGQSIDGFEVTRISARQVTLVKEGIEVELEM